MTGPIGHDRDPRDELVLEEARRAVDQQVQDLGDLRARASSLAGYAVLVAGFLGGIALRDGGSVGGWMFAGFVALVGSVLTTVFIQWPRTFTFSLDAEGMDSRIDEDHTMSQMTRDASLGLAAAQKLNKGTLGVLHLAYSLGLSALVAEVVLLLVDLTRR